MPQSGHDLSGCTEPLPGPDFDWGEVSDTNVALKTSQMNEQAEKIKECIFYQSAQSVPRKSAYGSERVVRTPGNWGPEG